MPTAIPMLEDHKDEFLVPLCRRCVLGAGSRAPKNVAAAGGREHLAGNSRANHLLTRRYRKPWRLT